MKRQFILLAIALVVILGGATIIYQNSSKIIVDEPTNKIAMIDFKFSDLANQSVSLSQFKGKPILLNFWSTTCAICVNDLAVYQEFYQQYSNQINFIMLEVINPEFETNETVKQFIDDKGYSFPVYLDINGYGSIAYNAYALPLLYLIDSDGYIVANAMGEMSSERLNKGLQLLNIK